jgi:hypothetical protein
VDTDHGGPVDLDPTLVALRRKSIVTTRVPDTDASAPSGKSEVED